MSLSTIINSILCFFLIIKSFDFGILIIKSIITLFYSILVVFYTRFYYIYHKLYFYYFYS